MKKNKFKLIVLFLFLFCFYTNVDAVGESNTSQSCPTIDDMNLYKNLTHEFVMDYNTGTYTLIFSNAAGLYAREPKSIVSAEKFYYADANGQIIIRGLKPTSGIILDILIANPNSVCDGQVYKNYALSTDAKITNIYYNNFICTNYRNKYGTNATMKKFVPICFEPIVLEEMLPVTQTITNANGTVTTITPIEQIRSDIADAEAWYNGNNNFPPDITGNNLTNNLSCNPRTDSNKATFYYQNIKIPVKETNYCYLRCDETVNVEYGPPVATVAGMHVSYIIKINTKVNCTVVPQNKPTPPTKYKSRCSCTGSGHGGEPAAGPTEDFDNCISSCDGGKYSQSCINKCYDKVYNKNIFSNVSPSNGLTLFEQSIKAKQVGRFGEAVTNDCLGQGYNPSTCGWFDPYAPGYKPDGNGCPVKDGCQASCEVITESYVDYNDPGYKVSLAAYNEALRTTCPNAAKKQNSELEDTKYTIKTDNVYSDTSKNSASKTKTYVFPSEAYPSAMEASGNSGLFQFPQAYINKVTGKVSYEKITGSINEYRDGKKLFYTSVYSKSTNYEWWKWKMGLATDFNDNSIKTNIWATFKESGLANWNLNISCFYSLVNKYVDDKGYEFIFRPIALDDVFPASADEPNGRNPRWNWSCNATNTTDKYYPITPVGLTEKIEQKGYTIYDSNKEDEYLDYDIVLTKEKIREIRAYNKGKTYTDYDNMDCTKKENGKSVCKSSFLTSLGSSVIKKRGLIGCNNQANSTTCDTNIDINSCKAGFKTRSKNLDTPIMNPILSKISYNEEVNNE